MTDRSPTTADLAQFELFTGIDPALLEPLAAAATRRHFTDGQPVFEQGGPADTILLIERGHVALRASAGGSSTIVMSAGRGDLLGWSALRPGARRLTTGRAVDDVTAIVLPVEPILDLLSAGGETSRLLIRRLVEIAAAHLGATQAQLLQSGREGVITGG